MFSGTDLIGGSEGDPRIVGRGEVTVAIVFEVNGRVCDLSSPVCSMTWAYSLPVLALLP